MYAVYLLSFFTSFGSLPNLHTLVDITSMTIVAGFGSYTNKITAWSGDVVLLHFHQASEFQKPEETKISPQNDDAIKLLSPDIQ